MTKKFKPLPSLEELEHLFVVTPVVTFGVDSGLVWKNPKANCLKPGSIAGTFTGDKKRTSCRKDWRVEINRIPYTVSRIIYKMSTGIDPGNFEIDHIDRNSANNNISNLRLVKDLSVQAHNRNRFKNNKTGVIGVSFTKYKTRPFVARLNGVPGKSPHIGYFKCLIEAAYRYNLQVCLYFPEYHDVKSNNLMKIRCFCGNCAKILSRAEVFGI